jgi:hypothetical protein
MIASRALLADAELVLDFPGAEVLVEAELQDRGVLLVEGLDDQTQRVAVEPKLPLLIGQGLMVGRGDQRRAGRVHRVGPASLGGVRCTSPRDLLQQRAPVLDDLAATLDRQQLAPRLLVDLLGSRRRGNSAPSIPRTAARCSA